MNTSEAPDRKSRMAREHWSRELARLDSAASLQASLPPPCQPEEGRGTTGVEITGELYRRLETLTGGGPFLLYTTLLSALKICIFRYTGTPVVAVGSPLRRDEGEPMPPPAVLPIVISLDGALTGRQILGAVRQTLLNSYAHQLGWSGASPCDVTLALTDIHGPLPEPGAGLVFTFSRRSSGLSSQVQLDRRVYSQQAVERLITHFTATLAGLLATTNAPISELTILSGAEEQQLVREWSDTRQDDARNHCIHRLFEEQVRRTPDAIAIVGAGMTLSYAELDARANALAHHLRSLDVGPEVIVGSCLPRGVEMIVGMLGILKAGGAFVPLDPKHPQERLSGILAETGAPVALTLSTLTEHLPRGLRTICLDRDREAIEAWGSQRPETGVVPENLAYVIYTSGSTGRPKGVQVAHRGLCNMIEAQIRIFGVSPDSRVLQFAAPSFDASVSEIFMALLAGASLWPVEQDSMLTGAPLGRFLAEHRITTATLSPSALASVPPQPFPELRTLIVAGEDCPSHVVADWVGRRFINAYGPTEATVCVTAAVYDPESWSRNIGRPLANSQVRLLGPEMWLLPASVAGELHVGGVGLARGYVGRPDLTAERFVPDPFAEEPGKRLYRTGDLARYRQDGALEFLGRRDRQVKVRGFRIELGEIEAVLAQHPAVREAAVGVRRDDTDAWLAAYVVHKPEGRLSIGELHRFVQEKLPEYMVPSAFLPLESLPLTTSGKVDHAALLALSPARPAIDLPTIAPRSPIEEVLASIWAQILQVDEVGIHDNFFELGGHSLRAVQVISRVSDTFQVELPLRSLFEPPTVAGLAARVEEALRHRQSLDIPSLVPAPRDGDLPLSFAQQRLWFLHHLMPESAAYNVPVCLRLSGPLQPQLLERVLLEVVERHEVLRTVFAEHGGQPVQIVKEPPTWILHFVDLAALPADLRESTALGLARQEIARPFDLARGPLLRATLMRLSEQEHATALTLHHIASDGWSLGILVREVAALYDSVSMRRSSSLPELPLQYADYAVWQRRWLTGELLESMLAFWREQLDGAPQVLELPTDRPRPASSGSRAAKLAFHLPLDLQRRLRRLGQQRGCTLFMVLLAAFQALLYRISRQPDLLVGSPVANRNRSELEGLIGFFVNTLVFRGRLQDDETFLAFLVQVRQTALEAYAHQDLPFERLVEALHPDRTLSRPPLFQVMLALQNAPVEALSLPGLELRPLALGNAAPQFDLTLTLSENEGGLAGLVEYDVELFDRPTMARLIRRFEALLESVATRPEQALADLPCLTDSEHHQLLCEWNDTAARAPQSCLHEIFAEQAARTPEAVAAIAGGEGITYRELDRKANRLAHHLRRLGVGPEVRVGLSMERSLDLLVGLLGILKAGGAYVPLDPQLPEQRTAFILEDARAPLLLSQRTLAGWISTGPARLVLLEEAAELPEYLAAEPPDAKAGPDNLAFMIYTSGSTGRPKGVLVPHRGVVNWILAAADCYALTPMDRVLQFASISFDVAADELFPTWSRGATLVLRPEEALADGVTLSRWIDDHGITVVNLPTAFWQQWARDLVDRGAPLPSPLRLVIVGSEKASFQAIRLWKRLAPRGARWINAYGPTEASVGTTVYELPLALDRAPADPPIGRPVRGTLVHLLDPRGHPVPIGLPGEIHIGGVGLTRGYLGRPEITAASFIPDPFSGGAGERLYRTGDRARRLPDGNLQFLSRTDHQVKIRGFRVELGEIEAALQTHPAVREAAVVLQQEDEPGARLVACLVPAEGGAPAPGVLRSFLRQSLPDYMMPSVFVVLESLPITPGGKVDRQALAALASSRSEADGVTAPPRTEIEEMVATVWSEILRKEGIGAHDSFFELGGHSLLSIQAVSRLRETFRVELPLRDLFDHPTVAGLAARIESLCRIRSGGEAPAIRRVDRGRDLPLSFPQARLWFFDQLQPGSSSYNCPAFARIEGSLDVPLLLRVLAEIIRRHEALRTTFVTVEGRPFQRIGEPAPLPPRVVDLEALPASVRDAEARRLADAEARIPFDLTRGPLFRFTLLRLGTDEHVALFTLHHIVCDGWSMERLGYEAGVLYDVFRRGLPSPLSDLSIQYADYAVWQREWLRGEVLAGQLAYWRHKLGGPLPLLLLPTDRPRSGVHRFRGSREEMRLPADVYAALLDLGRREGATLFMTLLAAFKTLLHRYSGQQDILLGTPVANRHRPETGELLGFFVNNLALRTDLSGNPTFRELLSRVRETTLQAFTHQDVPFEKLVEELHPERSKEPQPLYRVVFTLQHIPEGPETSGGLRLSGFKTETGASKLDLLFSMTAGRGGLTGAIEYDVDLFERGTILQIQSHFAALLKAVAENPDHHLIDIQLNGADPGVSSEPGPPPDDEAEEFSFVVKPEKARMK